MPVNHVLLETIELGQSAASITFDNIPTSGYSDLKIVSSIRSSRTSSTDGSHLVFKFNNNSDNLYSFKHIRGTGSAASSYSETNQTSLNLYSQINSSSDTANNFSNNSIYIPEYRSGFNKTVIVDSIYENNATRGGQHLLSGVWASSAAITSIVIQEGTSNNFVAGSTFSLYGISATGTSPAIGPKAQGGNIVANDGTYWYHAFLTSGTFTPTVALTSDVLVIAGGGSGGAGGNSGGAGGGGAGGLLYFSSQSVSTATNVVVGAGGPAVATTGGIAYNGNTGNDSQFGALTLVKGGGYGGGGRLDNLSYSVGGTGGSGGGAGRWSNTGTVNGGAASPAGQGNAGGNSSTTGGGRGSGGGGGAGAAGTNGVNTTNNDGAGGAGINTYSTWATATSTGVSGYYAGGGGGSSVYTSNGTGGAGGGGAGGTAATSSAQSGTSGTYGTGGGGGGMGGGDASVLKTSGAGGSGIVIIRYTIA